MNPTFPAAEAERVAGELYGLTVSARQFPSERDQNFLLEDYSGERFVLKIAAADERREALEAQNLAMEYVAQCDAAVRCPRVCPTLRGEPIATVADSSGTPHFARVLTYLRGKPLVEVHPHSPELLRSIGGFFGRLDRALEGFSHPGARRDLQWDLKHAGSVVRRYLEHISELDRRGIVEHHLAAFEASVVPALPELRTSVIHNDGNDHNVLVADSGSAASAVVGIIDFGDVVESATVFELAVCTAYALLADPDPLRAAAHVIRGYHEAHPLTELEQDVLPQLITMRLSASVAISAYRRKHFPTNEYLVISEQPVWEALERLADVSQLMDRTAL